MSRTPLALLSAAFSLAACASQGAPSALVLIATPSAVAPVIDGVADDAAWESAREVSIPLVGEQGPTEVLVRAVVHEGVLHLAARWADDEEDRAHKVWTFGADGAAKSGPEREDVFAVGFPIRGEFTGDMTSPVECVWDVWQWKLARTDPAGFAMDKSHVHSFTDPGGKRHAHDLPDGRKLYIRRPEDAGTSATRSIPAPATSAAGTAQYAAQTPSGSAADVRARGVWKDGWRTLELARALRTGHADDADLVAQAGGIPFSVAVLDRAEDEDHSTSDVWHLLLPDAAR